MVGEGLALHFSGVGDFGGGWRGHIDHIAPATRAAPGCYYVTDATVL